VASRKTGFDQVSFPKILRRCAPSIYHVEIIRNHSSTVSLLIIKMHEATYKQFITATIQDSSGKHPETILKPKDHKHVSSCHATIINHLATILNSTDVNQRFQPEQTNTSSQPAAPSNYLETII
jgi:hypothetical protein